MAYFANGTEAMFFEEQWCRRCIHYGPEEGPGCPIWFAHLLHAYDLCNEDPEKNPGKQILDMLITEREETADDGFKIFVNECQMFVEAPA